MQSVSGYTISHHPAQCAVRIALVAPGGPGVVSCASSIQSRSPLGDRQRSTLNHWAFSPALRRCEHLLSNHDDTQLSRTCHESPLKCHLRRPCSSPGRFGSRLSLGNRYFPNLPLVKLHTKPRLGARESTAIRNFLANPQVSVFSNF